MKAFVVMLALLMAVAGSASACTEGGLTDGQDVIGGAGNPDSGWVLVSVSGNGVVVRYDVPDIDVGVFTDPC